MVSNYEMYFCMHCTIICMQANFINSKSYVPSKSGEEGARRKRATKKKRKKSSKPFVCSSTDMDFMAQQGIINYSHHVTHKVL